MKYLHTMVRVNDLDASLRFYVDILGLVEVRRVDYEAGRFTLVFLSAPDDVKDGIEIDSPLIELTHKWDTEALNSGRNFGHLAFRVKDIYETCAKIAQSNNFLNPTHEAPFIVSKTILKFSFFIFCKSINDRLQTLFI